MGLIRIDKSWQSALLFLPLGILLIISIWVQQHSGIQHPEHQVTIPHYLSDRPLLHKLFDVRGTEAPVSINNYQARELSYFTDYLDVQFMSLFAQWGMAHYLSLTKYVLTTLIMVLLAGFFRKDLRLDLTTTALTLILLASSPSIFLAGYFHHSAKIGTAFGVVLLFVMSYRYLINAAKPNWIIECGIFVAGTALCLFDLQGVFFSLLGFGLLVIRAAVSKNYLAARLMIVLGFVLLLHFFYRYYFAPWLIHEIHGYYPGSFAHTLNASDLYVHPLRYPVMSFFLLVDYLGYMFGNVKTNFATAIFLFFLASLLIGPNRRIQNSYPFWIACVTTIALIYMLSLMWLKFDFICFSDLRLVYYPLATVVVLVIGLGFSFRRLTAYGPLKFGLQIGLTIAILSNLYHLPQHKKTVDGGSLGGRSPTDERISKLRLVAKTCQPQIAPEPHDLLFYTIQARVLHRCLNS